MKSIIVFEGQVSSLSILLLTGLLVCGCTAPAPIHPPIARIVPHASTTLGDTRIDNYYWLRERDNPEVINYLEAENTHTAAVMKHTQPLQERLYEEMKDRIKETDLTVPAKDGAYWYYSRTLEGKQYSIECRKKGGPDGEEEVLLDQNKLAKGHAYFRLAVRQNSPNHRYFAYSTDTNGSETYTLRIKDLQAGAMLPDEIPNTYYGFAWANDNLTIYYTTLDSAKRPYRVYRHVLGTDAKQDELIYHEADEAYHVSLSRSHSRQYIFIESNSKITSEVRYLDANRPGGMFQILHPRQHGMEYSVEHHGDFFYIVTNDEAVNFKLMRTPISNPAKVNWMKVIPHRPEVKIDSALAFKNYIVVSERERGLRQLQIRDMANGQEHTIEFPEPVYTVRRGVNREFDTNLLRFQYTSLVTPRSIFDYNMDARTRVLMKQDEVLGGYDPTQYRSERRQAMASDGTSVPISLVYRKGLKRDGHQPLLLYGYGSYGASMDPYFSSNRVSLLDRGVTYAIAHIRGGGDLGRPWYEDGKFLNKKNTFTDFIACAEFLIAEKYTSPNRLAIMGGSAGGLLMGAVTNMRPDLFNTVVAKVPFVDVLNTMLDPTIPLTVIEYEEWGNPNNQDFYEYMKSYSPYDNVEAKDYPNILITAGLNDPRVQYWEPAKWTAKLRSLKTDENILLLKTIMGAGHGGKSGRYDKLKEVAFDYAFILDRLGLTE